jgi:hypothetical protein
VCADLRRALGGLPVFGAGNSAIAAIDLLRAKGVAEDHIIFLTLIAAPQGIAKVCERYPHLVVVTSEVDVGLSDAHVVLPGIGEFGDRYFGTDCTSGAIRPGERASAGMPVWDSAASGGRGARGGSRAGGSVGGVGGGSEDSGPPAEALRSSSSRRPGGDGMGSNS